MFRTALKELEEWKNSPQRKPMIIDGARQVGKTWLMKEFGRTAYADTVYVNFDGNGAMKELFSQGYDIDRLILGLELYSGKKIDAGHTLLIFDEVQEVPQALTSLKYFCEDAPQYHILCAGSLLGIALHAGTSFPVGKVQRLKLYPLTFSEFLSAIGMEQYADLLAAGDFQLITAFKSKYIEALKQYYFTGGMPEAVSAFAEHRDLSEVREIQNRILNDYEQDFSKHAPNEIVPRIRMVWHSIPSQLAKENRKFVYGVVREGGRAKDFETAIMWLTDCGLVQKVRRVSSGNYPPAAYEDLKAFKLFVNDIGLLGCMCGLDARALLAADSAFVEFKGALTEQYVVQQLTAVRRSPLWYYTNDRGSCEIDLIANTACGTVPVEVKAEINLQAKSLKAYREKYAPRMSVRLSMSDYRPEDGLLNLPLYAAEQFDTALDRLI